MTTKQEKRDTKAQAEAKRLQDPTCQCGCGRFIAQGRARLVDGKLHRRKCAQQRRGT